MRVTHAYHTLITLAVVHDAPPNRTVLCEAFLQKGDRGLKDKSPCRLTLLGKLFSAFCKSR